MNTFHRTSFPLIRANNSNAFHSGEWAKIIGISVVRPGDIGGINKPPTARICFAVEFINGDVDQWPVEDQAAEYEFYPSIRSGES